MPSNPRANVDGEAWMAERQNVDSRKTQSEKRGAERDLDRADGGRSNGSSAHMVAGGLIGGELWNRTADTACREVSATIERSGLAVRGLCEMQTQWWSFLERTLRSSLDASERLQACADYVELMEHQRRFVEERVQDLVAESTEMLRISARVAASSIEPSAARSSSAKLPVRS
jgi:hypothetical protein